jgi:hypothetical protein
MHDNPAADWQALTENYRRMFDEELLRLGDDIGDLTPVAQEALRAELKNHGLGEPGAERPEPQQTKRHASTIDSDAGADRADEFDGSEEDEPSHAFTWKTPLCDCESEEQALGICEMLRRAKIESWYEAPGQGWSIGGPRVVVAADRLDEARQVIAKPVPQDILDDLRAEAPEYEAPRCPACHAEDPVLESAEPSNSWLCEVCGKQWSDPAPAGEPT